MVVFVGALTSCSTTNPHRRQDRAGTPLPLTHAEAAHARLAAHPGDHDAQQHYRHSVERLVKWYDAQPPAERERMCREAQLTVEMDPTEESGLHRFTVANTISTKPLANCHVRHGFGVPVVAWRPNDGSGRLDSLRPPEGIFAPLTAVLDKPKSGPWTLRFLSPLRRDTVTFAGRQKPLASDLSATVATLVGHADALRRSGRRGMLNPTGRELRKAKLYLIQPYNPTRIPLIMVHGLQSTPVAFGNLVNDLIADPIIRSRYQIWHYHYPTGTPVLWNAAVFRKVLRETMREIDPEGDDFATNHLLVMGHSMGGILARTLVTETGYKLWDAVIKLRPEQLTKTPESRKAFEEMFIFHPDRRVMRLVFINVPHGGSALADNWIGDLGQKLFRGDPELHQALYPLSAHYRDYIDPFLLRLGERNKLSSIRTLSARSPALRALSKIPPAAPFHSIIGQKKEGPVEKGHDGVVPYSSSHVDGAESELIVRSGHGAFRRAEAVAEIKRILRLNLPPR